jgi:hypothetical protein
MYVSYIITSCDEVVTAMEGDAMVNGKGMGAGSPFIKNAW